MAFKIPNLFAAGTKAIADRVNENFAAIEKEINQRLAPGLFKPGDLKLTASANAPEGWLLCHGQAVSRTTYSDLFEAIGTTYGAGDGATTFNLPDYRGRTIVGPDNGAGRLTPTGSGGSGPNKLGEAGGSQHMPAHNHGAGGLVTSTESNFHNHNIDGFINTRREGTGFAYPNWDGTPGLGLSQTGNNNDLHIHAVVGNTAVAGGGSSGNMPPYQVCNVLIKI